MRLQIFLLSLVPITACALIGGPNLHDLELTSVEVVDLKSRADFPSPGDSRSFKDRIDFPWLGDDLRPSKALLMVGFATDGNLRDYARRYEYTVHTTASLCNSRVATIDRSKELQYRSGVFDDAGVVDFHPPESAIQKDGRSTRNYHLYIDVRSVLLAGQETFQYDLQAKPEDLCFMVSGGNMLGNTFTSNIVRIPKDVLSDAISYTKCECISTTR